MSKALQPVVKVWLHSGPPARLPRWGRRSGPPARAPRWGPRSTGYASPSHPHAAAAFGAPAPAALLLAQILPVLPPHRANHARRGPRFSVVPPCPRGGAPNAAAALGTPGRLARLGATPDFHHGLLRRRDRSEPEIGLAAAAGFEGARRTLQNRLEHGAMRPHDAVILVHFQHAPERLLERLRIEVIAVEAHQRERPVQALGDP